ncbi:ABC transporter substrate-binding protein [Rhodospirillum rubrum]|uniref:Extracellular solute-binding protein, family 5 n=1 Tax=Rhodospirillum rubrum (strain ATCC 11170 / ATH 1.1.1 / DSM 467 / LMG 4362 / NCIMB 8255 / S1) TaxID=269796 RepID=Q2RRT9_RHORT|nr:ABC transporter substrate-binding protein [Rhodospirillum rubrum]ABC23156.1 extracellular solute-binding protein, family 5 [Rhodospirillum rubrum ATCC 11170]AEO48887.1 extracellular solute-binding protein [Rhodospirillum rubrum F11]MBK5954790.1 ABC transporter substrate-binding protein [Rhodospirillum rubrum]QXG79137.1 ABC transporter substrate-binding protein [Rhodospirillum rubrum]HCF18875.1 ABC transporter substrate-binding protein [Rhodospirillum rubrum]
MRKIVIGAASAVILAMAASGAQAKTLVYCSEGSPEGFNPAFYTTGTTFDATSKNIFDKLVLFKRGTTEIEPGLAESWEVSPDGKTYTFHLRKGVTFHDSDIFKPTRQFNADDVIWSFERQLKKDHPYHAVSGGTYDYFEGMSMNTLLEKIEKVDDYTVVFHLSRPEAPMLANLAMDFASIFSAEYADKMMKAGTPEVVDQKPIGTGPFMFRGYQKDAQIRYEANPTYWQGKAAIDRLVFVITPDASVRYAKLKAGECHVMPYPNPADLEAMKTDKAVNLMHQEGLNVGYLAYNVEKKPFDDVRVRKALNLAIDKKAIIDAVYQGAGTAATNPIPPTIWSYNKAVKDDAFDPAAAKKLLAEAGVKDLKTTIWAMPVQRPYNPNARRMAEILQANWKAVGVDAEITSYEWGEYLKRAKAGEHETALFGWTGDNGDPDNFLAVLLGCDAIPGNNYARWCDKSFENLIQKAKIATSQEERVKLYEEAQVIFKEQAPWATIAHSVVYEPIRKEVIDYKIDPLGGHIFYGVDLKK